MDIIDIFHSFQINKAISFYIFDKKIVVTNKYIFLINFELT